MQGKVVIVTGAFGALGRAVVIEAKARGARVAMLDRAAPPAEFSGDALAMGGLDLTAPADAARAIAHVHQHAGRIDALLNIAGGFAWKPVADAEITLWDQMQAINLKTAVNASKAALPHLVESKGAIVNVGAGGALKAGAGMAAYAAAKQGVHKLTEALAEEMNGKVRVNAVLPSILDTPQNRKDMPNADFASWVAPADLAKVMLFLAADDARAITGALIPVTGGV